MINLIIHQCLIDIVNIRKGSTTLKLEIKVMISDFGPVGKVCSWYQSPNWNIDSWNSLCKTQHIVCWEPEGHYHYSTMFHWETERRYCFTKSMVIVPFWFTALVVNRTSLMPFWFSTDDISGIACGDPECM